MIFSSLNYNMVKPNKPQLEIIKKIADSSYLSTNLIDVHVCHTQLTRIYVDRQMIRVSLELI